MGYYIDQLAEQDRQRKLAELLAMQEQGGGYSDMFNPNIPLPPQREYTGNTLADLARNPDPNWSQETKDALARRADLSGTLRVSHNGNDVSNLFDSGGGGQTQVQQPGFRNTLQIGDNAPVDLGRSQRSHDVWADGPQEIGRYQLANGTTEIIRKIPVMRDGRQSVGMERLIETPDYLNPAKLKELEFQKKRAELAQLQAKPTSGLDAARAKILADIEGDQMKSKIPGTAEYERVQKRNAGERKEQSAWSGSIKQADQMDDYINRIIGEGQYKDKGSKLGYFATGLPGQVMQNIGGTDARDLRGDLNRIKAIIGFEELNKMRRESPTGGALGNVTERELEFLQSVEGSLDQAQSPEQIEKMLWDVKSSAARLKNDLIKNPPRSMSGGGQVKQDERQTTQLQEGQLGSANGRPAMVKDGKWVYLK